MQQLQLSAPLFGLIALGYLVASHPAWRKRWSDLASIFVFRLALPAMLFRMMATRAGPSALDPRILLAFFGGCFLVFALGRVLSARAFGLDGADQSLFGICGVFSNNVLLGIPMVATFWGPPGLAVVAFVLVFNSLLLWTLVTLSVEWARHGSLSLGGVRNVIAKLAMNPIVVAIVLGTVFEQLEGAIPGPIDASLKTLSRIAGPCALVVLGLGLPQHSARSQLRTSIGIWFVKLLVQPLVVWSLALALSLPDMERHILVLLASLPVGANAYLMSLQFDSLRGGVAGSLVMSTAAGSVTTSLVLMLP